MAHIIRAIAMPHTSINPPMINQVANTWDQFNSGDASADC